MLASRRAENPDRICSTRTAAARSGSSVTGDGPYMACLRGKSFPLGATLVPGGANFSVFAKHSTGAQLLLFDDEDAPTPAQVINLDPRANRTYHYWHVFVPGVTKGQIYGYRIAGPFDPERGLRFDLDKVLLDPYGKCIARPEGRSREATRRPGTMPLRP